MNKRKNKNIAEELTLFLLEIDENVDKEKLRTHACQLIDSITPQDFEQAEHLLKAKGMSGLGFTTPDSRGTTPDLLTLKLKKEYQGWTCTGPKTMLEGISKGPRLTRRKTMAASLSTFVSPLLFPL